ncbi:hypothetical protein niasHT_003593 [Heterodera trifolii]|uniref:Protein inscuteable homologue C-terminal domain-containing protein n=1 Tax=Heterodera trifolii TaxID=157864 RepID=A0ABD2MEX1_9BILA
MGAQLVVPAVLVKAASSSSSSSPSAAEEFDEERKSKNHFLLQMPSGDGEEKPQQQKTSAAAATSSGKAMMKKMKQHAAKALATINRQSDESSLDPKVGQWLQGLKWRAELETMSVLYAKSVPPPTTAPAAAPNMPKHGPTAAVQRVALRDRPISMSKSDVSDRHSLLAFAKSHHSAIANPPTAAGCTSPPRMRRKLQQNNSKQSDQLRSNHRSTVCLSSSGVSPSLVMNRQSIVIVPASAGEDGGTDGDEMNPFNKSGATDCGTNGCGTLTKFAQSLPNDASLGERLMAQRRPTTTTTDAWRLSTTAPAHKPDRRVPSLTTMDYAELPLCDPTAAASSSSVSVYQPRIKYRRNRKGGGGLSASVYACGSSDGGGGFTMPTTQRHKSPFRHNITDSPPLRSGGALAVRPIAFRHSIRVNELDESNELMSMENRTFSMPPSMSMSLFCTSSSTNKFNCGGVEDESPYEEGTGSLDSGQCSGSSPPFFNNGTLANASALVPSSSSYATHQPALLLQRQHHHHYQNNNWFNNTHPHHQRQCSTSSEAGTTASSSVEMPAATKFGSNIIEQRHGSNSSSSTTKMPSYARTANCIAQVLRLSSIIFANLGTVSSECRRFSGTKKLLSNTKAYIRLLSECPCAAQMPQSEMELVRRAMQDAEGELLKYDNVQPNDYLAVCVRRMLEQTLLVFIRLISHYLAECTNHDQLLLIALEQFVHLLLWHKAMDNLLALALVPLTGSDTLKLLLRTMSVLCGTAKGCIQLLSIGGLDLVLRVLRDSTHADCSIEAAGCLAQLCSPSHCFLRLSPHSLHALVPRLLKLVDHASAPEALLLCLAALANLCAQCAAPATELLYTHNAVLRLVKAAGREHSVGNLFVQEELVTIFTRMANRGFERALVAQGAIPVLCRLLQLEAGFECQSQRQSDFQRRVSYKAAVCLGILASTGSGLKALYEQEVHKVLSKILRSASGTVPSSSQNHGIMPAAANAPPIQLICSSISQRLQHTYQLETAV